MRVSPSRRFAALAMCALVALAFPLASAQGQYKFKELKKAYFGVKSCSDEGCHGRVLPSKDLLKDPVKNSDELLKYLGSFASDPNVGSSRKIEYHFWSGLDKHKDAADVLDCKKPENARSRQIAKIMKEAGIPIQVDKEGNFDLTNERRCATCHGSYIPPEEEQFVNKKTFSGPDRIASGVACVVCHGPYSNWVNEHLPGREVGGDEKSWSEWKPQEKETHFGLNNLWDPEKRARLCFSCHIGNAAEGKIVTHLMYAAGHPPLPSIEIATFSEAMPAHWESQTQKAARARELDKEVKAGKLKAEDVRYGRAFLKGAYGIDADKMPMEQMRLAAVSSLVALEMSAKLLSDFPAVVAKDTTKELMWPELAFYDCYACHHELKPNSWRIQRGYQGGKPGRPTLRSWPYALATFGNRFANSGPLDQDLSAWNKIFQTVPFGDPKQVAAEGAKLETDLNSRIKKVKAATFNYAAAVDAAQDLADLAKASVYDYDSARQLTWALRTIALELQDRDPKTGDKYVVALPGEFRIRGPAGEEFVALEKPLQLKLPQGKVRIETVLGEFLNSMADYQPATFQSKIEAIQKALPKRTQPGR